MRYGAIRLLALAGAAALAGCGNDESEPGAVDPGIEREPAPEHLTPPDPENVPAMGAHTDIGREVERPAEPETPEQPEKR